MSTKAENESDKVRHGTLHKGELVGTALTDAEVEAATLAIWNLRKHSDPASVDSSTLARVALEAAAAARPKPPAKERVAQWYVGAKNDALFIIDRRPRPSTDDIVDVADVSIIAGPLKHVDAERIVGVWNIAVDEIARLLAKNAVLEAAAAARPVLDTELPVAISHLYDEIDRLRASNARLLEANNAILAWLRQNANAEKKNPDKRAAFIEAHNAALKIVEARAAIAAAEGGGGGGG